MTQAGLWQKGKIGPYVPIHKSDIDEYTNLIGEYINKNFQKTKFEKNGIIYISSLKSFFHLYLFPKLDQHNELIKSYLTVIPIELEQTVSFFFIQSIVEKSLESFLRDTHRLDAEGRFEDIVNIFKRERFDDLLHVENRSEKRDMIDRIRFLNFKDFYKIFGFLLAKEKIYLLNRDDEATEEIIHMINLILSDIVDVRAYLENRDFPILIIDDFSTNYIEDRKKRFVLVDYKNSKLITEIQENTYHEKLIEYNDKDLDEKLLFIKGYIQQIINDYYHQIREISTGNIISKKKVLPFLKRITPYNL